MCLTLLHYSLESLDKAHDYLNSQVDAETLNSENIH